MTLSLQSTVQLRWGEIGSIAFEWSVVARWCHSTALRCDKFSTEILVKPCQPQCPTAPYTGLALSNLDQPRVSVWHPFATRMACQVCKTCWTRHRTRSTLSMCFACVPLRASCRVSWPLFFWLHVAPKTTPQTGWARERIFDVIELRMCVGNFLFCRLFTFVTMARWLCLKSFTYSLFLCALSLCRSFRSIYTRLIYV